MHGPSILVRFSDGFALNVGREEWQRDRSVDCYHAVSLTGLPFKLFMSYDMTYEFLLFSGCFSNHKLSDRFLRIRRMTSMSYATATRRLPIIQTRSFMAAR